MLSSAERIGLLGVCLAVWLIAFGLIAVPAQAQVVGATVTGTITDPSGAVVANASITATDTATNVMRTATSDAAGLYTIPNLTPGPYEFKVTATGFSTKVQNLQLAVGQQLQLNFQLAVGQASTTVEVTEAAPQIDLTSSAVSGQVESQTVRELPLNGRDWTQLTQLQPGVKPIETQMSYSTSARGNRGFGGEMTISGQRSTFNNYRIDGITVNDYANAAPGDVLGIVLGVDAIQEFQVMTGGFPAQYGRATGGVINAITRSGTNQFHGAAYDFLRNSALDSNDYFDRAAGNPKPPFKRNQFGVSAGAPIIKDKLFVFADYEGIRQSKGIPTSTTVFSQNAQQGFLGDPANPTTPPALGLPAGTSCTVTATGAPGVYVGPKANTCYSPYAAALLPLWPLPNTGIDPADANRGFFTFAGVQDVPENFGTARIDYNLGTNDKVFGVFLRDQAVYTQPDAFNDVLTQSSTSRTTISIEEDHTFSSSLLNAARVGFNRDNVVDQFTPTAINPLAANLTLGAIPGQAPPRLSVKGGINDFFGGTDAGSHYLHVYNDYQFYDDAIWTHGNHTINFGGGAERIQYNEHTFQEPGGRYIFNGGYTSFLEGLPSHWEAGLLNIIDEPREFRQSVFSLYVEDNYKVKSNLTVNLGVRYEPSTVLNDAQGRITNLNPITATAPTCGTAFSVSAPPYNLPPQPGNTCGAVGPYYNNPTLRNFEPRIGFAWDPFKNGKTSVRGNYGIYDVDPLPGYFLLQQNQAAPFLIFKDVTCNIKNAGECQGLFYPGGASQFAPGVAGQQLASSTASLNAGSTIETSMHRSYVQEWGLNIQRQLTQNLALTVGYAGSHGVHLITRGDDGNMVGAPGIGGAPGSNTPALTTPYGYLFPSSPTQANRVNPLFGTTRYIYWNGSSNYNALDVNLTKNYSNGLQFQIAYTFSKSLDDTSQTIAGDTFANGINSPMWWIPQVFYGPSDFNVTHTLSINALYTIPTPKQWNGAMKEALADWEVGSIVTINSGTPTTPLTTGDTLGLLNGGADPYGPVVPIAGCNPYASAPGGGAPGRPQLIDQNCYTLPYVPSTYAATLPSGYTCDPVPSGVDSNGNPFGPGVPGFVPLAPGGAANTYCTNLMPFNGLRNSLYGPMFFEWDVSLMKTFPIKRVSEAFAIQFRAEAFDITNHDNFVPPQPNSGDSNSALINTDGSYAGVGFMSQFANANQPDRELQFALKVVW